MRPRRTPTLRALPSASAPVTDVVDAELLAPAGLGAEAARRRPALRPVDEESGLLPLGAAVAALLGGLGRDRHEVARTFAEAGLRGWPGHPDMDPLCRWLHREIPDTGVWLAGVWLRVWLPAAGGRCDIADVPLPAAVADYARAARAGAYPYLRLSYTPPTVAVPHVDLGGGPVAAPWRADRRDDRPPVDRGVDRPGPVKGGPDEVRDLYQVLSVPLAAAGDAWRDDRAVVRAGRRMAHEAYGDAVAMALELRGVPVGHHGAWPPAQEGSEALRAEGRRITIALDTDAWTGALLPGYAHLYLHWSERHGWTLVPVRDDGHADTAATLSWWDTTAPSPVLPAPAALAGWVAAVAEYGPDAGPYLPTGAVAAGVRPLWRAADTDDAVEAVLDTYRASAGHRVAAHDRDRDALADTVLLRPVESGSRP